MPVQESAPAPALGPVRPKERIETIDILRGFALFGVILANFQWMIPWELYSGTADQVAKWLLNYFVFGRFFRLFAFLFGLGFALQMTRMESRGVHFVPLYLRRLIVLLLFGLLHGTLLWPEDVLAVFAKLGFLLFLFRARSPRTLVAAALLCLLIFWGYTALVARTSYYYRAGDPQTAQQAVREAAEQMAESRAREEEKHRIRSQGTYGEIVAWNTRFLRGHFSLPPNLGILGEEFVMFLLGLAAGRRRIFENIPTHLPFIRKVMWWGLGLGLVGSFVRYLVDNWMSDPTWPYFTYRMEGLFWGVGAPALCLFYASALTLLVQREEWKRRLTPLAAIGRTALTNYMLQSVVITTAFYSYGLGFYGKVGMVGGVGLAILTYALQIPLSMWWLRRFRFGPAEWLWRTLTYGKLQPMRVSP